MNCSIKDEASEAGSETGSESILPDASINLREELEIEKVSDFLRFSLDVYQAGFSGRNGCENDG